MAAVGLLSLPDFPTEMQDLEDDLEHVIINPIDYVAPNNQPVDEIPQPKPVVQSTAYTALSRGIDSLCLAL
jgi:hypothetical protein